MARTSLIAARARVVTAALIGCATSAWAPPAACLSWARFTYARGQGAESCPDETTLRAAVVARLGYDPFVLSAERTIIAMVAREHRTLRANVQIVDETGLVKGVRRLEAGFDQCRELAAAMALAISIAVDPTRVQAPDGAPVVRRSRSAWRCRSACGAVRARSPSRRATICPLPCPSRAAARCGHRCCLRAWSDART